MSAIRIELYLLLIATRKVWVVGYGRTI